MIIFLLSRQIGKFFILEFALKISIFRCIEMISNSKLYEPIIGDGEAAVWVNIYANSD